MPPPTHALWPWLTLAGLGLYHGANPAMGWLFAVSRGLQERRASAVALALPPLALGHALSIGLTVGVLALGEASLSVDHLRWATATLVVAFGIFRLVNRRHPRWVGMRVGFRDLTVWSFLMATAHGAGLMLLPLFLAGARAEAAACGGHCSAMVGLTLASPAGWALAVAIHTGAMLLAAGTIAAVVYGKIGLAILRTAWFNLDAAWAVALVSAGAVAVFA